MFWVVTGTTSVNETVVSAEPGARGHQQAGGDECLRHRLQAGRSLGIGQDKLADRRPPPRRILLGEAGIDQAEEQGAGQGSIRVAGQGAIGCLGMQGQRPTRSAQCLVRLAGQAAPFATGEELIEGELEERQGTRRVPRSRSATPRTLKPARSASSSWVSPAACR